MQIQSKLTKLKHEVTPAEWKLMGNRGDHRKYDVLSNKDTGSVATTQTEAKTADRAAMVKEADVAYKAKDLAGAKVFYLKANTIKETKSVSARLDKIDEAEIQYADIMKLANKHFDDKEYKQAQDAYTSALQISVTESAQIKLAELADLV